MRTFEDGTCSDVPKRNPTKTVWCLWNPDFSHYINDAHIYVDHIDGLKEQLKREPHNLPTLEIQDKPFWELEFEDFQLCNYEHHPIIKFPVAV